VSGSILLNNLFFTFLAGVTLVSSISFLWNGFQ
jgi:hypothetical protein